MYKDMSNSFQYRTVNIETPAPRAPSTSIETKAQGKVGRPRVLTPDEVSRARTMKAGGMSYRAIAAVTAWSRCTVQRAVTGRHPRHKPRTTP